ncbi:hypothetical protein QOT17_003262 [Balamuthia mandrillaris]
MGKITAQDAEGWIKKPIAYFGQCYMGLPFTGRPLEPEVVATDAFASKEPVESALPAALLPTLPAPVACLSITDSLNNFLC